MSADAPEELAELEARLCEVVHARSGEGMAVFADTNTRKEFFFASPAEVRVVLASKIGNLLEFSEHAEATEYLQSVRYWPKSTMGPR